MLIRDLFLFFFLMQKAALDALKASNPDGHFWIKLGATVLKGDEDLGDGQLQKLNHEYEKRYQLLAGIRNHCASVVSLIQTMASKKHLRI